MEQENHIQINAIAKTPEKPSLKERRESFRHQELQEVAQCAYEFIKDRATELGISVAELPMGSVLFSKERGDFLGWYSHEKNNVNFGENKNPSLTDVIHEELHFAASLKDLSSAKNENPDRVVYKSGFASSWKNTKEDEQVSKNLESFNEAVTDKLAQELSAKNRSKLSSVYTSRFHEAVLERNNLAEEERRENLSGEEGEAADMYDLLIDESSSLDEFKNERNQVIENQYREKIDNPFGKTYLREDGRRTYSDEVELLDTIIDSLAKKQVQEKKIAIEEARLEEWQYIQKAYFEGNTMALGRIDQLLGPGILQKFNEINRREVIGERDKKQEFKDKISALKEKILQNFT